MSGSDIREAVRATYGEIARQVAAGRRPAGCGGAGGCCGSPPDPITSNLYAEGETAALPGGAVLASLGCGNPTALAELHEGEVVLDLGSGGGIDVLLSARRVGPSGKAYGLDFSPEMLALARENQRKAGVANAEFLEGEIERIPLPDASVDAIISNCVINLSADQPRALAEAFRVLKPGGRLALSDVVVRGELPEPVRRNLELWVGCVAGALEEREYRRLLAEAGFERIEIEPTRVYQVEDVAAFLHRAGLDPQALARELGGRVMSAFVRARKPVSAPPVALRPAVPADRPAVERLLREAGLPLAGVPASLERFIVAEEGSTLLGAAGFELYGEVALLRSVVVAPARRGSGIGRTLVARALAEAERAGARDGYLLTQSAGGYFSRFGFAPVERRDLPRAVRESVEFRDACPAAALVMHRRLARG